jgi:hypothetical protein
LVCTAPAAEKAEERATDETVHGVLPVGCFALTALEA